MIAKLSALAFVTLAVAVPTLAQADEPRHGGILKIEQIYPHVQRRPLAAGGGEEAEHSRFAGDARNARTQT